MTRKTIFLSAALVLLVFFGALPLAADILVWSTGVRMRVRETLDNIDRSQPVAAVTLVDSEGRLAPVWIRPGDLDWEKTLAASEGGEAPTLGNAAFAAENIAPGSAAMLAAETYVPSGDVAAYDVKGKMLYGDRLVSGRLRNETPDVLVNIRVKATCLDRRGKAMASGWGTSKSETLVPGQETTFEVIVRGDALRYVEEDNIEVAYDVFKKSE